MRPLSPLGLLALRRLLVPLRLPASRRRELRPQFALEDLAGGRARQ